MPERVISLKVTFVMTLGFLFDSYEERKGVIRHTVLDGASVARDGLDTDAVRAVGDG